METTDQSIRRWSATRQAAEERGAVLPLAFVEMLALSRGTMLAGRTPIGPVWNCLSPAISLAPSGCALCWTIQRASEAASRSAASVHYLLQPVTSGSIMARGRRSVLSFPRLHHPARRDRSAGMITILRR